MGDEGGCSGRSRWCKHVLVFSVQSSCSQVLGLARVSEFRTFISQKWRNKMCRRREMEEKEGDG